jgi:hypothetical protein
VQTTHGSHHHATSPLDRGRDGTETGRCMCSLVHMHSSPVDATSTPLPFAPAYPLLQDLLHDAQLVPQLLKSLTVLRESK